MAQYYRIVHSVEELKSSCSNMGVENVQFVPVSSEEFQHHQVIIGDPSIITLNEGQMPQLVYQTHPQGQIAPTQFIIQDEEISENFTSGQTQQIFYTPTEISTDSNQIVQQSQIVTETHQIHQQMHSGNDQTHQVVIQQLQQQDQQSQQIQIVQQTNQQQVMVQPQQHIVVHNSNQNNNQPIVLQQQQQVHLNRQTQQQTAQRQIIYNTNKMIYGDLTPVSTQQQITLQSPQVHNQTRPQQQQQQQQQVQQQQRIIQRGVQQHIIRHQTPNPRNQAPTQFIHIQNAPGTPAGQRYIIAQYPQITRHPSPRPPRAAIASTPRAVGPRAPTPRGPRPRAQTPAFTKFNTKQTVTQTRPPALASLNMTPQLTTVNRVATPQKSPTFTQKSIPSQIAKLAPLSQPTTTKTLPNKITPTSVSNNTTASSVGTIKNQIKSTLTQAKSVSPDFVDIENSIPGAVVNKPSQSLQQYSSSPSSSLSTLSSSSQELSLTSTDNMDPKKFVTLQNGKHMTIDAYQRMNRNNKFRNNSPSLISTNSPQKKQNPQQTHSIHPNRLKTESTISTTQLDETRNSAKMLVILESGEQRLITFTLPKETCTVQELLEQVGVQFSHETNIQCVSNPGASIDYVVTVGTNLESSPSELVSAVENSIQNKLQNKQQPSFQTSQQSNIQNQQHQQQQQQQTQPPMLTPVLPKSKSPELPKEPPPKYIDGFLAVCVACGYSGLDHSKCQRCRRIFTEEPKKIPYSKSVAQSPQISQQPMSTSTPINRNLGLLDKDKKSFEIHKKLTQSEILCTTKIVTARMRGSLSTGRGRGRGRGRAVDIEPVILTLSSDDEGESQSSPALMKNTTVPTPAINGPLACEPSIPVESTPPNEIVRENVADVTNSIDKLYTTLQCRVIRIGSHKYEPTEKVIFSSKGIRIIAPNVKEKSENHILDIQSKEVVKMCSHFSKTLSIIFIYVLPSCAQFIRDSLDMSATNKTTAPYFNPIDTSDYYKKIILQIDTISEECKSVIRSIYKVSILEEISARDAHELLSRSNYDVVPSQSSENIRQILIYPQGKGGISINTEDYMCLGTDQYLNDVIIDFYLNYLQLEVMTEEQKSKTHIFSSFFYKRLTTTSTRQKQSEKDIKLTAAQKRHQRVKSWTKNVNIFEKDFVIIPINEQSHWFLAIICFPGLKGPLTIEGNVPVKNSPTPKKKSKKKTESLLIGSTTITPVSKKEIDSIYLNDDSLSERDEAEGDDSEMATDESDSEVDNKLQPIKQPCILIFDSLAGASRSRVVATLRDYLTCEYKAKIFENSTHVFNKLNIPGNSVKVPQQNNFTDCGLYLLQYVEHFFKEPITDYKLPIKQLANWFESIVVTKKREDISNLLHSLIKKYNPDRLPLPEVSFPTIDGKLIEMEESFNEEAGEFEEDGLEEDEFEEDEEALFNTDTESISATPEKKTPTILSQNGDRKRPLSISTISMSSGSSSSEPKIKKTIKLSENQ